MIDLHKLRHAILIAEMGSFSAAAAAIPMSQSALTRSIQSLENDYAVKLFERGRGGARLTAAGAKFVAHAEQLLQRVTLADDHLRSVTTGRGESVAFGIAPMSTAMFLSDFALSFLNDPNDMRLRVIRDTNSKLLDLLWDREIEFYIGSVPHDPGGFTVVEGLSGEWLPDVRPAVLVRNDHPLLGRPFTRADLHHYPVITGPFVRDPDKAPAFSLIGLQAPTIELDDYDALGRIARSSDALLYATEALARVRPDLNLAPLPVDLDTPGVRYAFIRRKDSTLSPAANTVSRQLIGMITQERAFGAPPVRRLRD